MDTRTLLTRIREHMQVRAADGQSLGRIRHIWYGIDPDQHTPRCDEDVCSRIEVPYHGTTFYIPITAIADVDWDEVVLTVDAATVEETGWYRKPLWIDNTAPSSNPFRPSSGEAGTPYQ